MVSTLSAICYRNLLLPNSTKVEFAPISRINNSFASLQKICSTLPGVSNILKYLLVIWECYKMSKPSTQINNYQALTKINRRWLFLEVSKGQSGARGPTASVPKPIHISLPDTFATSAWLSNFRVLKEKMASAQPVQYKKLRDEWLKPQALRTEKNWNNVIFFREKKFNLHWFNGDLCVTGMAWEKEEYLLSNRLSEHCNW